MLGDKLKGGMAGGAGTTLISRDTEFVGDVKFSGTLDIEGNRARQYYGQPRCRGRG